MTIRPYQTSEYPIPSWSIDYSEHHSSGPSTWFATPNDTAPTSRPLPVLRTLLFFITLQLHALQSFTTASVPNLLPPVFDSGISETTKQRFGCVRVIVYPSWGVAPIIASAQELQSPHHNYERLLRRILLLAGASSST